MRKPFSSEASATPSSKPASTASNYAALTLSILFFTLALTAPVQAQEDDSTALKAQTQAYIVLVYADDARDQEKWKDAAGHYNNALKSYKAIQSAHPGFNDEIIAYRIAYCQNQLTAIQRQLRPASPPKQSVEFYESKYNAALQENTYLRSRLKDLEKELDDAGAPADMQQDVDRLKRELAQLKSGQNNAETALLQDVTRARKEADHFRAEVDRQKSELADLKEKAARQEQDEELILNLKAEINSIRTTNKQLTHTLQAAETTLQEAEKNLLVQQAALQDASKLPDADLQAATRDLKAQVKNEQNINKQLIQQIAAADQRVRDLQEADDARSKELAEFGRQIATLLGREADTATAMAAQKKELTGLLKERDKLQKALDKAEALEPETVGVPIEKFQALEALRGEVDALKASLAGKEKELKDLAANQPDVKGMQKKADAEIKELKESLKAEQKKTDDLAKDNAALADDHRSVQEALKRAADDLQKAQEQENDLKAATAAHKADADKQADAAAALAKELDALKKDAVSRSDMKKLSDEVKSLTKALQDETEARADDQKAAASAAADRAEEIKALTTRITQLQNESESLSAERDQFKAAADALDKKLSELASDSVPKSEFNTLSDDLAALKKAKARDEDALARLAKETASMEPRMNSLKDENKQLKDDLKASLKALDNVQDAMEKSIKSKTRLLRDEVDRLVSQVADLTSYRDSVGGISAKELFTLRSRLAEAQGAPEPTLTPDTSDTKPPIDTMLREGQEREREGNFEEASALYRRIREIEKNHAAATKGLARIYLQMGKSKQAVPLLDDLVDVERDDSEAMLLLGLAQYNLDDYRKASSTLKKLVKMNETSARGWNALGASMMAQEKYRDARSAFERAIGLEATLGDAHYNLAQVLRLSAPKEKDLIRQHYQTALSLGSGADPDMDAFLKASK